MPGFELIGNEEFQEIEEIFAKSKVLFRHGFDNLRGGVYKVREFEAAFSQYFGVNHAVAVTSGTAALRVALAALDIGPGDEVITQSFTFVATVEAIVEAGATPVITEIDDTLNMDPEDLKKKITPKTKAIIVVHMLGVPCRMNDIMKISERNDIPVIEDTAWGCGGKASGQYLGTIGKIGTYSFDFAKVLTTGEGGMVVTNDPEIFNKAAAYHDHGHENNPNLPRWEDSRTGSGFNYRMSELQGAVGLAQLKKLPSIVETQRSNCLKLMQAIEDIKGISFRAMPESSEETADALIFSVDSNEIAREIRAALLNEGIGTKILPEAITWHFAGTWTHIHPLVDAVGGDLSKAFPNSLELLTRAVALPVMVNMAEDTPNKVRTAIKSIL